MKLYQNEQLRFDKNYCVQRQKLLMNLYSILKYFGKVIRASNKLINCISLKYLLIYKKTCRKLWFQTKDITRKTKESL